MRCSDANLSTKCTIQRNRSIDRGRWPISIAGAAAGAAGAGGAGAAGAGAAGAGATGAGAAAAAAAGVAQSRVVA